MRFRSAGVAIALSGALTMFVSVFAAGVLFILAAIPFAVGVFQSLTGIRLLVRAGGDRSRPRIAAGVGIAMGVLYLPGMMFNPRTGDEMDAARLAVALLLIGANGAAISVLRPSASN